MAGTESRMGRDKWVERRRERRSLHREGGREVEQRQGKIGGAGTGVGERAAARTFLMICINI